MASSIEIEANKLGDPSPEFNHWKNCSMCLEITQLAQGASYAINLKLWNMFKFILISKQFFCRRRNQRYFL